MRKRKLKSFLRKWGLRYIKYNIVGVAVFLINVALYYLILFPAFGEGAYIIVSIVGGIIEFTLITYINKTGKGIMFESCTHAKSKIS